ncbi:MAG: cephalosporin hydroxylase family protein [Acidobacteriia bacterium]|nr:cephalosporin hydroxylase family protein [Terriglobia bacterium]
MKASATSDLYIRIKRFRGLILACVVLILVSVILFTGYGAPLRGMLIRRLDAVAIKRVQSLAQWETVEYDNHWQGVRMLQYPSDLVAYENIIFDTEPDFIVETGTYYGGMTLYLATLLDCRNGAGTVISVDIDGSMWDRTRQATKIKESILGRITFINGSSTAASVYASIAKLVAGHSVLVILDSNHAKPHVVSELNLYSNLVKVNGYILVNDTHIDNTVFSGNQPGPLAAVKEFLSTHPDFRIDRSRDRYFLSCVHSGFLKRIR